MESFASLPPNYVAAIEAIDAAHAEDPNTVPSDGAGGDPVPYELHYARKMTRWLARRKPDASPALQLACRAQHFRRWELPRTSYPPTRAGYLTWRARQKSAAAARVAELLASSPAIQPPLPADEVARVAALVRKENLPRPGRDGDDGEEEEEKEKEGKEEEEEEAQVLEDVACLVFLDDQFDAWFFDNNVKARAGSGAASGSASASASASGTEPTIDEDKMVGILRKTWAKMSGEGRRLALEMRMSERAQALIRKALEGC